MSDGEIRPDDLAGEVRELQEEVRKLLDGAWRPPGFCVPNQRTYPHQWLWDSCFHAIVWSALDDDRCVTELEQALANQDPATGFVPHLTYWADPSVHQDLWGRPLTSTLTQPPMYGHAANLLMADGGRSVPDGLLARVEAGLRHLLTDRPRTPAGLVPVWHPWETGCDDSPRWDRFRSASADWRTVKGELVAALRLERGVPVGSSRFAVGSIGFNALLAWNTREYLALLGRLGRATPSDLEVAATELAAAIAARWEPGSATWLDDGPGAEGVRTADALLALLVDPRPDGLDQLHRPDAFGARYGPRGVHRAEPGYRPTTYWRGPAWPQLSYLLWRASVAAGDDRAPRLAHQLVAGARRSGWAEYWHPDTGTGLGAMPQTWSGLALLAARAL